VFYRESGLGVFAFLFFAFCSFRNDLCFPSPFILGFLLAFSIACHMFTAHLSVASSPASVLGHLVVDLGAAADLIPSSGLSVLIRERGDTGFWAKVTR